MKSKLSRKTPAWTGWIVVPLRLFLGVTFVYAGIQKLTDPQYFNPNARAYIGHQIAAFATGSPLHNFLVNVALPWATLFGAFVVLGELAIGLCVLLGLLLRPAAFFGLLLNLVFFLSADWRIFPYFYGSDIVFVFCWLTLLIAGPMNQVLPALDIRVVTSLIERADPARQQMVATICAIVFGVKIGLVAPAESQPEQTGQRPAIAQPQFRPQFRSPHQQTQPQSQSQYKTWQLDQARQQSRRNFVWGTLSGGTAMLVLAWLFETLRPPSSSTASSLSSSTAVTSTIGSPVADSTPNGALPNGVITRISDVPTNSSVNFTLPSNGDPALLIHLSNGQFVAYDAVCTHAGCPVDYDPSSHDLICPCHGAAFDPAKSAAVLNGPAQTPLTGVPIKVDQNAGTISLSQ